MKLLIEPHYLGSIEYFCLIKRHSTVLLEINDHFQKQSYRNRAYILGSNKILSLHVPLNYTNKTTLKDVRIDHSQRWVKDHWGAIYSSYGKAPFFEFFANDFKTIWEVKHEFLLDLNVKMLMLCLKLMDLKIKFEFTDSYVMSPPEEDIDYRNHIHPKIEFTDRNIYQQRIYSQLFGNRFVPNLSIVDLIMCEGPQAGSILTSSSILDH